MKDIYYVYILQNPKKLNGTLKDKYGIKYEPFYVGKGKNQRSDLHYKNVIAYNSSHNSKLLEEINSLRTYGSMPVVTKIFESTNEELVYKKEQEAISYYGLRYKDGLLVNSSSGKAGGWGGELNPTFDRMERGSHNFLQSNPQLDTPKINALKKMILEVEVEESLLKPKWITRTGYSTVKSLKIGISRIIKRDSLNYSIVGNTLRKIK